MAEKMDEPEEYRGPYTCIRCLEPTFNDCDVCDECLKERLDFLGLDEDGNEIPRADEATHDR